MKSIIQESETPIKSRPGSGNSFTSFVFACLHQVDDDPETSAQELRLAWFISQMLNNKTRVCFPLQSTLAQHLGVSDRAIRQYITGLVHRGHLKVRHRGRDHSSIYELILHDRNIASGHDAARPEDTFRSNDAHLNEDRISDVARPEVSRRKTGTVLPTEPTSEPSSKPEERGAPQARRTTASSKSRSIGKSDFSTVSGDSGVAMAPPPSHLQLAIERAYRQKQQAGV